MKVNVSGGFTICFTVAQYQISAHQHFTFIKGLAEDHRPLCILKRGAWWAARFCSSILLILPSPERLVSVGDGLTMEVISLISASIVAHHIINVHLWKKLWPLPRCFCNAWPFSLCWIFSLLSVTLYLHAALPSPCCILADKPTYKHRKPVKNRA